MPNVSMTYGDYSFSPVPIINVQKQHIKSEAQIPLGSLFRTTLNGTLIPTGGGLEATTTLMHTLRTAFSGDGQLFSVQCNGNTVLECNPRILNIQFNPSNNNWVSTLPYTVELEYDNEPVNIGLAGSGEDYAHGLVPPFIDNASESWGIEFIEENSYFLWNTSGNVTDSCPYTLRVTHNVAAKGRNHYTSGGVLRKAAWQEAQDYVSPLLGFDSDIVQSEQALNLDISEFENYNHIRTNQIDELGGNYNVTETWLLVNSGNVGITSNALEDFTATTRTSLENDITTVSLDGNIQGLETRIYTTGGIGATGDFSIQTNKYDAANSYWNVVQDKLFGRALYVGSGTSTRDLNPVPNITSVGHNPTRGIISYAYEYNDRPCNFITNSLYENISINDTNPTDIFAELVVLGRAVGPILQSISTVTSFKRNVSIDATMPIPTIDCSDFDNVVGLIGQAPTGDVGSLLCSIEAALTGAYSQVFKSQDSSSWEPKTGRYNRQVEWTVGDCSGSINTSFC